jgi:hypothetical protein
VYVCISSDVRFRVLSFNMVISSLFVSGLHFDVTCNVLVGHMQIELTGVRYGELTRQEAC